jgi:hypothetical protein
MTTRPNIGLQRTSAPGLAAEVEISEEGRAAGHLDREVIAMMETRISLPELALIGGTRALLGAGLGLLLADRLPEDRRKAIGWMLVGVATTIPLAIDVLGSSRAADRAGEADRSPDAWPAYAG